MRIANELAKRGLVVSPPGVRCRMMSYSRDSFYRFRELLRQRRRDRAGRDLARQARAQERLPSGAVGMAVRSTLARAVSLPRLLGRSAVNVICALDVILAKVAADLNLDQLQPDLARVLKTMPLGGGDVDALVLADELHLVADRDLGGARHDHPMLGTVVVHLHRELAAGVHVEQLHLKARADR